MEFPKMLYKAPGPHEIHGGKFDYKIVNDEAEHEQALADGWSETTDDAKAAYLAKLEAEAANSPPTRDELEQKATELGVKFDGRTTDRKLFELIEAKLKV